MYQVVSVVECRLKEMTRSVSRTPTSRDGEILEIHLVFIKIHPALSFAQIFHRVAYSIEPFSFSIRARRPTFELADGDGLHPLYKASDAFTNEFNLHNSCLPAESYPMSGQATCFPRDTVFAISQ